MGGLLGGWVKKVKELRSTNWWLQNSQGDIKYGIGNIVNNIVGTVYDVRVVIDLLGRSVHKLYKCLIMGLYT